MSRKLNKARIELELFYDCVDREEAYYHLEEALVLLYEKYFSPDCNDSDQKLIENLISRLYTKLINECARLRAIEPIAEREEVEHWIRMFRVPPSCGWPYSGAYSEAWLEINRIKRIIDKWKGHLSRELRYLLFELDLRDLELDLYSTAPGNETDRKS